MNDWVRLFIDRLLGWPVAAVGISLVFQSPIKSLVRELTAFVGRANHLSLKLKDTTVEALSAANPQAKKGPGNPTDFDLGEGTAISPVREPVGDVALERDAVLNYGRGVASVKVAETSIRKELERLGFNLYERDTVDLLVRQLAAQLCVTSFERIYRVIFGSQISALEFLNSSGPMPATFVEAAFYETAKNAEESFYSTYPFSQWLSFLTANLMIAREGESLGISIGGRDFLIWMVNVGVSNIKPH